MLDHICWILIKGNTWIEQPTYRKGSRNISHLKASKKIQILVFKYNKIDFFDLIKLIVIKLRIISGNKQVCILFHCRDFACPKTLTKMLTNGHTNGHRQSIDRNCWSNPAKNKSLIAFKSFKPLPTKTVHENVYK